MADVPPGDRLYFVHSYRATPDVANEDWVLATCEYGGEFIAAVQKGEVMACQFHPEKSGEKGLSIFRNFLEGDTGGIGAPARGPNPPRTRTTSASPSASSRASTSGPTTRGPGGDQGGFLRRSREG